MTTEINKGSLHIINKKVLNICDDGSCPVCNTQLKIIKREEVIYKTRILKVIKKNGQKEIRCPKCKNFILEI